MGSVAEGATVIVRLRSVTRRIRRYHAKRGEMFARVTDVAMRKRFGRWAVYNGSGQIVEKFADIRAVARHAYCVGILGRDEMIDEDYDYASMAISNEFERMPLEQRVLILGEMLAMTRNDLPASGSTTEPQDKLELN